MTTSELASKALENVSLDFPVRPKVTGTEVQDFVSADGEDALRVYAYLDESTRDEELIGAAVLQIRMAIQDTLLSQGIQESPYTIILKKSEMEAIDDEWTPSDATQ